MLVRIEQSHNSELAGVCGLVLLGFGNSLWMKECPKSGEKMKNV